MNAGVRGFWNNRKIFIMARTMPANMYYSVEFETAIDTRVEAAEFDQNLIGVYLRNKEGK